VRFFTRLREITGKPEEKLDIAEDATVNDVLETLIRKYGKDFREYLLSRDESGLYLQFLIDGRNVTQLDGLKTKLRQGNTLAIIPPVGGG